MDSRRWAARPQGRWTLITGACALAITGLDALLQNRKYGLFTGGYLSQDHLGTLPDAVMFLAASLAADAAVTGMAVAVALWGCRRLCLRPIATVLAAAIAAVTPLAVTDFFAYQIAAYLGSAFDLDLVWQLNGGRLQEMLAVAASHLIPPLAVLLVGAVTAVWIGGLLHRDDPQARHVSSADRGGVSPVLPIALFLVGAAATCLTAAGSETVQTALARKPAGRALQQLIGPLSDIDGDGYGLLRRPADPAPRDARIHPYAVDIPGDGIDQDGIGGDLPLSGAAYSEGPSQSPRWQATPDVLLVVLESIRWDVLAATERGRPVAPVLQALAAGGVASPAYAHTSFTAPSWHHLLSGTLANLRGGTTLVDDFKANGYQVAYFSAQDQSYGGPSMPDGFDRADVAYDARQDVSRRFTAFATPGSLGVPFTVIQERVAAFLEARRSAKPLFLVVNFEDSHFPYHHAGIRPLLNDVIVPQRDIGAERADEVRAMYHNTAANVDRAVGEVLERVTAALGREPAVIVTSDHGESLFEEGFLGHGYALNDVQSKVPLIVRGLPLVIEQPFGQSDLRAAISAALSTAPAGAPVARVRAEKTIFQYVGTIDRPRQIGWVGDAGARLSYDFAQSRARIDDHLWRRPEELPPERQYALQQLMRRWEWMVVARDRHGLRAD